MHNTYNYTCINKRKLKLSDFLYAIAVLNTGNFENYYDTKDEFRMLTLVF